MGSGSNPGRGTTVLLLSMTGHGEGHRRQDGSSVAVEVRSVNNRYLKISLRAGEGLSALEPELEAVVRRYVRRGSLMVNVRVDREATAEDFSLNETVLTSYWRQLESICEQTGSRESIRLETLLGLPGVVVERPASVTGQEQLASLIEAALVEALENLARMRAEEGAAMAADLAVNCESILAALGEVQQRAPQVVAGYRRRLQERLNKLLQEFGVSIQEAEIVREVGIFADRSDISEEIVRLQSHLDQFRAVAAGDVSNGRKLEFLVQEMLRETNTIGSKASDAEIAGFVVEIKAAIERMREMIQNVE